MHKGHTHNSNSFLWALLHNKGTLCIISKPNTDFFKVIFNLIAMNNHTKRSLQNVMVGAPNTELNLQKDHQQETSCLFYSQGRVLSTLALLTFGLGTFLEWGSLLYMPCQLLAASLNSTYQMFPHSDYNRQKCLQMFHIFPVGKVFPSKELYALYKFPNKQCSSVSKRGEEVVSVLAVISK